MTTEVDDFLAHYGVKGMRWGVIRNDVSTAPKTKTRDLPDSQKSKRRISLEAKYLKQGLTLEKSRVAADRQLLTEKILLGVGGVAVTAAVAYVATNEISKRFASVTLEKGRDLNYINALGGDKIDLDRRIYTTFQKRDTDKYRGLLARQLKAQAVLHENGSDKIYDTVLSTTKQIKAPSQYQAKKIYKEFVKEFGIPNAPSYNQMNQNIVGNDLISKGFMAQLTKKGYNAVLDANDQFMSGYNTKKPLIIFNAASSTVKRGEKVLDDVKINDLVLKQSMSMLTRAAATSLTPYVGLGVAVVGARRGMEVNSRYSAVNNYFKKHPESELSYAQAYNLVKTGKSGKLEVKIKKG